MPVTIQSLQASLLQLIPLKVLAVALVFSVLVLLASLFLVPWLLARIPERYFAQRKPPPSTFKVAHPALGPLFAVARNILGMLLLIVGVAMLVLPGQGILTIIAASFLLQFPGKYRLQRWILRRSPASQSINWLRQRLGKPPLQFGE